MPESAKKTVKRKTPPKKAAQKPNAAHRKPRKRKKTARRDFSPALLLTAGLIAVSILISIAVLGIKRLENRPAAPLTMPESGAKPAEAIGREPEPSSLDVQPEKSTPPTAPEAVPSAEKKPVTLAAQVEKTAILKEENPPPVRQVVLVIDDAGNSLQELEPFLRFPGPLTIAVLPGLPYSAEAARQIRAAGKEVFLHQPMEALGGQNPGPGAIYAGMGADEIAAVLSQNLAEIGPVAGMNNHQGSKITMDGEAMEAVLAFCREQGICFLDSRTTAGTAAPAAAQKLGIKIGERNIFIDNEQSRPSMSRSIEDGLALASQKGSAVMIGHAWSPELAPLLAELHENFADQGYTLATASALIKNEAQ